MLKEYRSSLIIILAGLLVLELYAVNADAGQLEIYLLFALIPLALLTALSFVDWGTTRVKDMLRVQIDNRQREYLGLSFQTALVAYLIALLVNEFWKIPGNLNYLLVFVLILGVLTVLFPHKHREEKARMKRTDVILVWGLGIVGAVLVFLKTGSLGWLRYVLSVLSGALIVLLGYLVYSDEKKEKPVYLEVTARGVVLVVSALFLLSAVLTFFIGLQSFRIVFGSVYVLFLPGFVLSYLFFDVKEIDALERIALSFALSIAVVPLVVFYLNLIGMRINALSVSLVVAAITILSFVLYRKKAAIVDYWNNKWRKSGKKRKK